MEKEEKLQMNVRKNAMDNFNAKEKCK